MSHVPRSHDWTMPIDSIKMPADDQNTVLQRYVFMILPLFLVLVPEASSDNMTEIQKDYRNILVHIITDLEDCKCRHRLQSYFFITVITAKSLSEAFTKYLYVIFGHFGADSFISRNITSSFNTNKRCHSFENATITYLTLCLKKRLNCTKITSDLKKKMNNVSDTTTKVLEMNGYTLQPLNHSRCCRCQCRNNTRKPDCTLCCLKNVVSALHSWWQKFLYHGFIPNGIK